MASRRVPAEPAPQHKPKVSVSQLRILLAAVEKDPWLYNAVQSDIITFLTIHKWKMLSDKLNECRGGAVFDVLNWKHVSLFLLLCSLISPFIEAGIANYFVIGFKSLRLLFLSTRT